MKNLKFHFALASLLLLSLGSCAQKTSKTAKTKTPACLKAKIEDWKKQYCEKGKSVKQYTFQKKTVFVFEPGNCGADMPTMVLDANCKELGALGGFAGNMDINGEDFKSAVYVKTVWKN